SSYFTFRSYSSSDQTPIPDSYTLSYTTLFRSRNQIDSKSHISSNFQWLRYKRNDECQSSQYFSNGKFNSEKVRKSQKGKCTFHLDRKSTRLNSSHVKISYAVFCLKKKNTRKER